MGFLDKLKPNSKKPEQPEPPGKLPPFGSNSSPLSRSVSSDDAAKAAKRKKMFKRHSASLPAATPAPAAPSASRPSSAVQTTNGYSFSLRSFRALSYQDVSSITPLEPPQPARTRSSYHSEHQASTRGTVSAGFFMQAKANRSQSSLPSLGSSASLHDMATSRPSLSLSLPPSTKLDHERPALAPLLIQSHSASASPTSSRRNSVIFCPPSALEAETEELAPPQPAFAKPGHLRAPSSPTARLSTAASTLFSTYFADASQFPLPDSAPASPIVSRQSSLLDLKSRLTSEPEALPDDDDDDEDDEALQMRPSHLRASRYGWASDEAQRQREQARLQAIEANTGGSPFAQSSWKPEPFRSPSGCYPSSPHL